jgi:hypothetical protein
MRIAFSLLFLWPALAQPPIDVGDRRQLLFDSRFVTETRGIRLEVHEPRKTGEVTIPSEEGRALNPYHSVLYDAGAYHLWYWAGNGVRYASSRDGIHFELRPGYVLGDGEGGVKGRIHGLMVFLDPKAPASERFRLVANPGEFRGFLQIFSSPDGIHWRHTHKDVLTFDDSGKSHHLDSQNAVFFDGRIEKYVAYVRRNRRDEPGFQGRTIARAVSDTLSFGPIDQAQYVFDANAVNIRHGGMLIDVYTNGAFQYPWADNAYFLFPAMYYHYGKHLAEFRKEVPTNAGVLDVRFAASRNGVSWDRFEWRPWVRTGMEGEFDSRRIYMVYGMAPSLDGRELYMYYVGTNDTHGWDRDDRNNRILTAAGVNPQPLRRQISRVVLRRDGFVSASAGADGGQFTTPPLRFSGSQLVLNVDTSALGEVQVEVQDGQGKPIPGFTLAESDIIHSANQISRVVSWSGVSSLEKVQGREIRLHFRLRNADVYAFQFRNPPSM